MADLIAEATFEHNSHEDKEQTTHCSPNDPGKSMLTVPRNESERRSEKDNKAHTNVNPGRVGIN